MCFYDVVGYERKNALSPEGRTARLQNGDDAESTPTRATEAGKMKMLQAAHMKPKRRSHAPLCEGLPPVNVDAKYISLPAHGIARDFDSLSKPASDGHVYVRAARLFMMRQPMAALLSDLMARDVSPSATLATIMNIFIVIPPPLRAASAMIHAEPQWISRCRVPGVSSSPIDGHYSGYSIRARERLRARISSAVS